MKNVFCFLISGIMMGVVFSVYVFGDEAITSSSAVSAVSQSTLEGISKWAEKEVKEAIENGIVPKELQGDYTKNITRKEFCKLCSAVMKAWNNGLEYKKGNLNFFDTNDEDILLCAEKGIVSGVGNNKFAPDNSIKRQEAARMLYNTLNNGTIVVSEMHGKSVDTALECCIPHSFDDGGEIKNWARNEINHMYRYGVMLGVSDNNYDPDGFYTREQAICTFLRLFNCYGNMEVNPVPDVEYYPCGQTAKDYISDGEAYAYGYSKENYKADYIDSKGNKYTEKEKGYIYPFDKKLGVFITSTGVGVGGGTVVDKEGNESEVINYDAFLLGSNFVVNFDKTFSNSTMYSLPDMKEIFSGNGMISYIGDNLCEFIDADFSSSIIDSKGNVILDKSKGYKHSSGQFTKIYNGVFVLVNKNGGFDILNSKCEVLKHFKVNSSWSLLDSIGTNAHFYNEKNDKHIFYRCYSGIAKEYDYVTLTENNEAIVRGPHFHNYILNADGTVKFDAGSLGYKNVEKVDGFDFYKVLKDNGESGLCDIVDKNGKIIKKDISRDLLVDKSGVFAYITDRNIINFFDFYGSELGKVDLSNVYSSSTKIKIKFINGMLFVENYYHDDDKENINGIYITPQGKRFI